MKKTIILLLTFICIIGLLTSCNGKAGYSTLQFSFNANDEYIGFQNLPQNYTIIDAEKDGCFLMQGLFIIPNIEIWDNFLEAVSQNINSGIRIVNFDNTPNSPYFFDLFYNEGNYYLFDSTSTTHEKQPFLYLLELEGLYGSPLKRWTLSVLTNDNTLTFDKFTKSITSSNIDIILSISPYKLIMFYDLRQISNQ